jgi:hypothetical protein
MCIVDHTLLAPGYIISARVESVAPPAVFTRILHHYREIGLTDEQIHYLLDAAREYNQEYMRLSVAFANCSADFDLVGAEVDVHQKERLLNRHAELFCSHETLLLRAHQMYRRFSAKNRCKKQQTYMSGTGKSFSQNWNQVSRKLQHPNIWCRGCGQPVSSNQHEITGMEVL